MKYINNAIILASIIFVVLVGILIIGNGQVNLEGQGKITEVYYSKEYPENSDNELKKFEITVTSEKFLIVNIEKINSERIEYEVKSSEKNFNEIVSFFKTLNIQTHDSTQQECLDAIQYGLAVKGDHSFEGTYNSCGNGTLTKDPSEIEVYLKEEFDLRRPATDTKKTTK